ncbi:MAG: HAMP domain-containing sensor histidine kinase [Inconstantimicrobium porci]|uniref:sensor histidine kinase n=1 Tax=Inconstantimicrobium porci TaxID=2652291 RepID=UPI002A90E3C8|nr:HAMP domain-containing sensor histidine kinase [Inconstantimicrobium porci]MDY5912868.1 HAMP domain-containing sensor histidine kinase [Inconstantimicrobium porci]
MKIIKRLIDVLDENRLWFIVVLALNILFGTLLWIIDSSSFSYIFPVMLIGSLIVYCSTIFICYINDNKRAKAFNDFLADPSKTNEDKIMNLFHGSQKNSVIEAGELLRSNLSDLKIKSAEMNEYEEYIEAWAHEIKTPLGLMTFVLDNRKEELSPSVYAKLEYSRTKIQENIERMLYYARLKATSNDFIFKELSLTEVCEDVLDEYSPILKEQNISITLNIDNLHVVSDKKSIEFIIRQIISNSIKYKNTDASNAYISLSAEETDKAIILTIRDNGIGVKPYDLPFVFEKGFTGEIGEIRKNSTGMGLYLSKQVAKSLKINIEASESYTDGLEIRLSFPKVEN